MVNNAIENQTYTNLRKNVLMKKSNHRRNLQITAKEVRVLSPNREFLGIMSIAQALELANQAGLELIEVVPQAVPPVCQITEYGKFMYEEKKRVEANQKVQPKVKEIYITPRIAEHDLQTKVNHALEFLKHNDNVKVVIEFEYRELQHKELGFAVLDKFIVGIGEFGKPMQKPKLAGRNIYLMLQPNK